MENLDQILDAPPSVENRVEYAGFWIRVAAFIIDYIVLLVSQFIVALMATESPVAYVIVTIFLWVGYFSGMESSQFQGTLGKLAVGIKVGDREGEQLTWPNALGRFLGKFLSTLIFYIGFMMAGWDDRKQGLHDKLADTFVYYRR